MSDELSPAVPPAPPAPPRQFVPLMDRLGELCAAGRAGAEYLWQVPGDESVRRQLAEILEEMHADATRTNRREMLRVLAELRTAVAASPSPQQAEILQDGFDRLTKLWQAAKSGLF
jgi:hypothetical protein